MKSHTSCAAADTGRRGAEVWREMVGVLCGEVGAPWKRPQAAGSSQEPGEAARSPAAHQILLPPGNYSLSRRH